ncbi:MAG: hypothetical protein OCD01_18495 [Fibrobacterales bacterium]
MIPTIRITKTLVWFPLALSLTLSIGCMNSTTATNSEDSSQQEESSEPTESSQVMSSGENGESSIETEESSDEANPESQSSDNDSSPNSSAIESSSSHTTKNSDDGPMIILTYHALTEEETYTDTTYGFGEWYPDSDGTTTLSILAQSEGYYSNIYTAENSEPVGITLTAVDTIQSDTLNSYSGLVYGYNKETGYTLVKNATISVKFKDDFSLEIDLDTQGRYTVQNKKQVKQIKGIKEVGDDVYGGISTVTDSYTDLQLTREQLFTVTNAHIYMYPEEVFNGTLKATYDTPASLSMEQDIEWELTASVEGLINGDWAYLYHDYTFSQSPSITEGWSIAVDDYTPLLKEKLIEIGLTAQEVLNLTTVWKPLIDVYCTAPFVTFYLTDLSEINEITASPAAETTLRYLIGVTQSSDKMDLSEPTLPNSERKGFTIVEAGIYFHNE